jgi:hypothetical protein
MHFDTFKKRENGVRRLHHSLNSDSVGAQESFKNLVYTSHRLSCPEEGPVSFVLAIVPSAVETSASTICLPLNCGLL